MTKIQSFEATPPDSRIEPVTNGVVIRSDETFVACRAINVANAMRATVTFSGGTTVENYYLLPGERPIGLTKIVGTFVDGDVVALY